jgi:hypothetical protein
MGNPFEAKESDVPCRHALQQVLLLDSARRKGETRPGMLALVGRLHGAEVHILVDSGAKESFVDTAMARTLRLKQQSKPVPDVVQLANGSKQASASTTRSGLRQLLCAGSPCHKPRIIRCDSRNGLA